MDGAWMFELFLVANFSIPSEIICHLFERRGLWTNNKNSVLFNSTVVIKHCENECVNVL